ncbi:MAG: hypothetical protein K6L73_06960 [Cellvibrionaceae bacterium]
MTSALVRVITLSVFALLLTACSSKESPSQVYDRYTQQVISGIDYKTDLSFYTERKQREIDGQVPKYMQNMHMSRKAVEEMYVSEAKRLAKCKELTLLEEKQINPKVAFLLYAQKDTCGKKTIAQEKQKVRMFNEGGWKIDEVEFVL